jgi:hypothetical protein
MEEEKKITEINGRAYTEEELEALKKDPTKRLIMDENQKYHLLERIQG